jgi:hypothetical protein
VASKSYSKGGDLLFKKNPANNAGRNQEEWEAPFYSFIVFASFQKSILSPKESIFDQRQALKRTVFL